MLKELRTRNTRTFRPEIWSEDCISANGGREELLLIEIRRRRHVTNSSGRHATKSSRKRVGT